MPITPVQYQPRPYVRGGTIGELIRLRGRNQAEAHLRSGDISAQLWANLGNQLASTIQGYAKERQDAPIRAQEAEMRTLQVQNARDEAADRTRQREDRSVLQSAQSSAMDPDQVKAQLQQLGRGDLVPIYEKANTELEASRLSLRNLKQQVASADNDYFGTLALQIKRANFDPIAVNWALSEAERDGHDVTSLRQTFEQDPSQVQGVVDRLIGLSPSAQKALADEADQRRQDDTLRLNQDANTRANMASMETALNTQTDNRRQDATLAETTRHNRALEGVAQQNANTTQRRYTSSGLDTEIPREYQVALSRATLNLPATRRPHIAQLANQAFEVGDRDLLADVIRQAAVETENVDTKNQVLGRAATLASLRDTRGILNEMKDKGVPTNYIRGIFENGARAVGMTTNPEYVTLGNRLMGTLINYRRAATGVQFSARESADYERMFPNYKNLPTVNMALIDGLEREMSTYDRTYWESKLGKEGAALIGVGQGITPPPTGNAGAAGGDGWTTLPNGVRIRQRP